MEPIIITGETPHTFADYFRLNPDLEELLAGFGYSFESARCNLPRAEIPLPQIAELRRRLESSLPHFTLNSETARREVLIAPVVMELALLADAKVKIEYPLKVTDQLQGIVDYLIRGRHSLLVIEAKNEDLQRGFTQLAVELIALSLWQNGAQHQYYGAVSVGSVWQFGRLDQRAKHITQDIKIYPVPWEVEELLRVLVGILNGT